MEVRKTCSASTKLPFSSSCRAVCIASCQSSGGGFETPPNCAESAKPEIAVRTKHTTQGTGTTCAEILCIVRIRKNCSAASGVKSIPGELNRDQISRRVDFDIFDL